MVQDVSNSSASAAAKKPIPWRLIIAGLIALAAVVFILQNTKEKPTLQFLWIDVTLPLWLLFVILIAVGMIIDRLIIWRSHHSNGE